MRFILGLATLLTLQRVDGQIEHLIRQCPEQYLWGYNRYKRPRGVEAPPEKI